MKHRSTMDFFDHRYFKITKNLMCLIGQWPYQSIRVRRRLLGIVIILSITHITPSAMAFLNFINDRNVFIDGLFTLFYAAWYIIKLSTMAWNSEKMLKMLNRIHGDWMTWSGDQEVEILHEYAEQASKFIKVYTVTVYSVEMLHMTQPILPKIVDRVVNNGSMVGEFPVPVYYYYFDEQKYYFYVVTWIGFCTSIVMTTMITYTNSLVCYVQHCCAIFTAVGHKLEHIGENCAPSGTDEFVRHTEPMDRNFESLIISCIKRHNDAIEYANLVESTFTWSFLATVILRIALISIIGLQLVTKTNTPDEAGKLISFSVALLSYVFIESYIAQIFMDHSISIHYCIQNGRWYSLSLKAQKLLQFMTMRCNIPCQMTAGKIINLSIESFVVFLKTSMSYLTVLRTTI